MTDEITVEKEGARTAMCLAFVAGSVDVAGYVTLAHMYTANMSGNSVILGLHVGQGEWSKILIRAWPIPIFVFGSMLATVFHEKLQGKRKQAALPCIFIIEIIVLAGFAIFGRQIRPELLLQSSPYKFYSLAALPAVAMGMQNATLHRIGSLSIRTTVVTGVLSNLGKQCALYLLWLRDRMGTGVIPALCASPGEICFVRMLLCFGVWSSYLTGAILAGALNLRMGLDVLVFPICILSLLVLIFLARTGDWRSR